MKGFRPALVGPIGEFTEVASANLAVRGVLMESVEEEELEVRDRTSTLTSFFSSDAGEVFESSDILGWHEPDVLAAEDINSGRGDSAVETEKLRILRSTAVNRVNEAAIRQVE